MKRTKITRMWAAVLAIAMLLTPIVSFAAEADANTKVTAADSTAGSATQVVVTPAVPATLSTADVQKFTDEFFQQDKVKKLAPGAVVSVVKDGKILLEKGYGYADEKTKKPVDAKETVFRIASVTKVFTAAAVMQLVEQGKIDLHADVQQYLGEAKLKNKTGSKLTMEHLLTHTSGVQYADSSELIQLNPDSNSLLKDVIRDHMPEITTKPGEAYSYDNFASMLQGYIVEQVSGMPFNQYVDKHILDPLGMNDSGFLLTPELKSRLAKSYIPGSTDNTEFPLYAFKPTVAPQGGMLSTGADMTKFMLTQLNGGAYEGGRILQSESLDKMLNPQVSIHPTLPNMAYGYEFYYHHLFNGQHVVLKGGDLPTHSSVLWLLPKQNTGIFIIYNSNGPLRDMYLEAFMDRYFPDSSPKPEFLKPTKEQLARYEGVYKDLRIGMTVSTVKANEDGTLSIRYFPSKYKQVDEFLFMSEEGSQLAFKEKNGQIEYAYNPLFNPASWAKKLGPALKYEDVERNHPYRAYIDGISSLITLHVGEDTDEDELELEPEEEMTRAEFAELIVDYMDMGYSYKKPVVADSVNHEFAAAIQTVVDMQMVTLDKSGKFYPDKLIQRQEAADMIWKVMQSLGAKKKDAKLSGKTDAWAVEAVKFMVANGIYGPEVKKGKDGSFNYQSHKPLLRQEAAAMFYKLIFSTEEAAK
ncbi:serine hydrolase [Paenibacillus sp. SC116]|uniref:serine hydrolase domain-containing protein n=1 Tax=Paenibacillus sp. SC116 TaxID=2968986 RepID=UPI00215A81E3|nr:serine hydrolase [Paenibacillus sp. SC116]MCR8844631.1 serine hydrolase [Paenibacillus sp. SC116]